jgi:hypothetical protein
MGLPQREDKGAGITVQGKGKGSGSAADPILLIYNIYIIRRYIILRPLLLSFYSLYAFVLLRLVLI